MRKILAVAFAIPLFTACTVGDESNGDGDEHPDPSPSPSPDPGTGDGVSGSIAANTSWSGTTRIKGATTIEPGVIVTVAAGTVLNFAQGAGITVNGTLKFEGTKAEKIMVQAETGATSWGPFFVSGTLDLNYADITGGAISTQSAAAVLKIVDSKMYKAGGDYIVMNGGSIDMSYSQVGAAAGQTDTTHCNFHINAASTIKVNNSNINGAPYGLMFYGGVNADFKMNNWYGSPEFDVATQSGVSGDFSMGYFQKGAPTAGPGATITATNLATAMIPTAGVR